MLLLTLFDVDSSKVDILYELDWLARFCNILQEKFSKVFHCNNCSFNRFGNQGRDAMIG